MRRQTLVGFALALTLTFPNTLLLHTSPPVTPCLVVCPLIPRCFCTTVHCCLLQLVCGHSRCLLCPICNEGDTLASGLNSNWIILSTCFLVSFQLLFCFVHLFTCNHCSPCLHVDRLCKCKSMALCHGRMPATVHAQASMMHSALLRCLADAPDWSLLVIYLLVISVWARSVMISDSCFSCQRCKGQHQIH